MKKYLLLLFVVVSGVAMAQTTQGALPQVAISEIMFNPPETGTDSLEYIEIHNFGTTVVDLTGWQFTKGILYTFAGGTLQPDGYLVLCVDSAAFLNFYGFTASEYTQALNNTPGDTLELRDSFSNLIDFVAYRNSAPWPVGPPSPAGEGPSIEFCDFAQDNAAGAEWAIATNAIGGIVNGFQVYGTPGTGCDAVQPNSVNEVEESSFVKLAPNPVENDLYINISGNKQYSMQVYDVTGKLVMTSAAAAGINTFSVANLNAGLYVARFNNSNSNATFAVKFLKK